jgi:anti-sigma regulatory factor (Ser/Thr protein kinase)
MARPSRIDIEDAREFASREGAAHPRDFTRALAARFGVTRAGVAPTVRRLEQEGFVRRVSAGTRPGFELGPSRLLRVRLKLPGVDESQVWDALVARHLVLPGNVANIVHYALTEMVSNANDHAGATRLELNVMQTADALYVRLADDGIGAFRRIARSIGLEDERLAVLELSKGKFTSDPRHHTGEGVFFTSRAMDAFLLRANGLEYRMREAALPSRGGRYLGDLAGSPPSGTVVLMGIALDSRRQLRGVVRRTTFDPDSTA